LKIRWEQRVTNIEVSRRTGVNNIVLEVKQRRWRWLGYVLRMNKSRHPHTALRWVPPEEGHWGHGEGRLRMKWPQRARRGTREDGWLKTEMAGEDSLVPYAPRGVKRIK
jgi:hypothetical protein